MLIKCPKCGFSQPQDQYCAQCGVDMVSYKPPQESVFNSFFKSTIFQVSLVVVIALVSAVTLYRQRKNEIQQRVTYLKGSNFPQRVTAPSPGQPSPDSSSQDTQLQNQDSSAEANQMAASASGAGTDRLAGSNLGSRAAAPGASASTLTADKKTKSSVVKVKVIYAEVSPRIYESIVEESGKSGQFNNFGDYSAGIIPSGLQRKIAQFPNDFKILRTDFDPIELGKSLNWSFNYHQTEREPANSDVSLSTFVNLEDSENQVFKGNLEIVRSQKESVDPNLSSIQKNNYPAVFELPQDASFFMSGLGSRKPADASVGKPESELVIFVQFEKGN